MADPPTSASPTPGPSHDPSKTLPNALYDYCRAIFDEDRAITQSDLLSSNLVPNNDLDVLLPAVQELVNQRLFRTHAARGGAIVWKTVDRAAAQKYQGLDDDQAVVYQCIEATGREGQWSKMIRIKTNLHVKRVENALKDLLKRNFIKKVNNVKYPHRITYILWGLKPSEEITGGTFFTDGTLDGPMVGEIAWILEMQISASTWHREFVDPHKDGHSSKGKERASMTKEQAEAIRDAAFRTSVDEPGHKRRRLSGGRHMRSSLSPEATRSSMSQPRVRYLPYPAGYTGYPTLATLAKFLQESKTLTHGSLPTEAVKQLLEVLVYDDKIFKLTRTDPMTMEETTMYKARRRPDDVEQDRPPGSDDVGNNGLTEVPCGRCPVFDVCQEGGPVSANNCEYWEIWLKELDF